MGKRILDKDGMGLVLLGQCVHPCVLTLGLLPLHTEPTVVFGVARMLGR